ncbi:hypothetical protein BBJ28_00001044 [Nothophytophthora sp. Chile5]|nr:hypothetical protein BBJ28_00001044 [Nothophytophthora sp. Chile5]
MWMSDKRPVQEELSSNLSQLVHKIPTPEAALAFVHSFFRTMHREWHGLDGLRLDKFYSLVRKFVHESVALLQAQDWDEELVEAFVTILSAEVVSQLPNGLRMHLADLYLTEIYGAAGKQVTTDAFVLLLEPFFALLGGEYDKTVFKRVRELVFEAMLTEYKFGPQPEKEEKDETDDEQGEEEEEDKVFELVELAQVQHRIFAIASADDTAERNRAGLYTLYKKFFAVTKVDSLQAAQEEAANPTKKEKKPKKEKKAEKEVKEVKETEKPSAEAEGEKKKSKKARKRKAKQEAEAEVEKEAEKPEEVKETEPEAATPSKKSKKQKVSVENEQADVEMATPVAERAKAKKSKKEKKQKQEKVEDEAVVEVVVKESSPAKEQLKTKEKKPKTEKKPKSVGVIKSGQKFQRCCLCGGFGKGLVPKNKMLCGHCERSQKAQKKKNATASKKRKAEAQTQAQETPETADSGKKVTFGKSKALRHEVSVKRLKASAKKDAVSKTEDIKGVLKASSPSPVASKKSKKSKPTKGRKTAADFF